MFLFDNFHKGPMGALVFAGMLLAAQPHAKADDDVWSYKDWSVSKQVQEGVQDTSITCTMQPDNMTGILQMSISHLNRDAGPPYFYPAITLFKGLGEDGQPMGVGPDDTKSTWTFDGKDTIDVNLEWDFKDSQNTFAVPSTDSQELLSGMAKGSTLVLNTPLFGDQTVSLSGFAAVYGKMADWCGFSTEGVLKSR